MLIRYISIVFVHGIRGGSHRTWSQNGVLWPRDLLAEDIPNARIMTVGPPFRPVGY